jgi:hypothetical protein
MMPPRNRSQRPRIDDIVLEPGITPEDYLHVVIFDYEAAARFVLDWAAEDEPAAAAFLAHFLAKVHRELVTWSHYLGARPGVETTFVRPRPSVSNIAFRRFCDLLFENRALIRTVFADPSYRDAAGQWDLLTYREQNPFALERGRRWGPSRHRFKDPEPLPKALKDAYAARAREAAAASARETAERREREAAEAAALRLAKKEARRQAVEPMLRERSQRSAEHKAFREQVAAKPLREQLRLIAWEEKYSIKVFPIDPDEIKLEDLRQTDTETLLQLLKRISPRWEAYWKQLANRVRAVVEERDQERSHEQ